MYNHNTYNLEPLIHIHHGYQSSPSIFFGQEFAMPSTVNMTKFTSKLINPIRKKNSTPVHSHSFFNYEIHRKTLHSTGAAFPFLDIRFASRRHLSMDHDEMLQHFVLQRCAGGEFSLWRCQTGTSAGDGGVFVQALFVVDLRWKREHPRGWHPPMISYLCHISEKNWSKRIGKRLIQEFKKIFLTNFRSFWKTADLSEKIRWMRRPQNISINSLSFCKSG